MKPLILTTLVLAAGCDLYKDTGSAGGSGEDFVGDTLMLCGEDAPADEVWISSASIDGDTLTIDVGFGGGCEAHQLQLCWDGSIAESYPMQAWVWISTERHVDDLLHHCGETPMTRRLPSLFIAPPTISFPVK